MPLPTGLSPGATARALVSTNEAVVPEEARLSSTGGLPFGMVAEYDESLYPYVDSPDLAQHYNVSQQMADRFGGAGSP